MSVSSDLQTQPSWLETHENEQVTYGFDEGGLWFAGNANGVPYPVRTNYDIDGETTVEVVYTFLYSNVDEGCPDHGICFFKADTDPYWSWSGDTTRIAAQYDCGWPEIAGQNGNGVNSNYGLQSGNTYTARLTYNPAASTITHELFTGTSASGSPADTITLEDERLSPGAYRVGFDADLDSNLPDKAYFTYLELSVGPVEAITHVFRALHFPHRRREVVSEEDLTPINTQPGEMLFDETNNKLYASRNDGTAIVINSGSGPAPGDTVVDGGTYPTSAG
jgi:hypothetical protein